jgi:hypothetical protein
VTDADLAALLAGKRDVPPGLRPAADVLAALSAEPGPGELAGEARALAEFRRRAGAPAPRQRAHGTAGLSSRLSTKVAAGAAAAAVVLGGAATAAFADMLPAPIQRFAHDVIGAPDAPSAPDPGPAQGKTVAPGQIAPQETPTPSAKPHSTRGHPSRPEHRGTGQGQQGNGQGSQQAQPGGALPGQGQQGDGQGQGAQGDGHGQGHQGDGQGQGAQGYGQGDPDAQGQSRNPHPTGQQGNPHPQAKPTTHHARPARPRPAMDP